MPVVEWLYYLATEGVAEKHDVSQADMKKMIEATIKRPRKKRASTGPKIGSAAARREGTEQSTPGRGTRAP